MASVFKSAIAQNVGTASTSLYTAPASTTSTAIGLSVCNTTASGILASVTLTKGATTVYLSKNVPIPQGSSIVLIGGDQKLVLNTGDSLSVLSSVASSVDAILSVLELT